MTKMPSQEELRCLFDYDQHAGQLIWRERPITYFKTHGHASTWNTRHSNSPAGGVNHSGGYCQVVVNNAPILAHRLIWVWNYGEITDGLHIDHIDGNRSNNRLDNLRMVTNAENGRNCKRSSNNTSGITGVHWNKATKKWRAAIMLNGKSQHLGLFAHIEDATEAVAIFCRANGFSERHISGAV